MNHEDTSVGVQGRDTDHPRSNETCTVNEEKYRGTVPINLRLTPGHKNFRTIDKIRFYLYITSTDARFSSYGSPPNLNPPARVTPRRPSTRRSNRVYSQSRPHPPELSVPTGASGPPHPRGALGNAFFVFPKYIFNPNLYSHEANTSPKLQDPSLVLSRVRLLSSVKHRGSLLTSSVL